MYLITLLAIITFTIYMSKIIFFSQGHYLVLLFSCVLLATHGTYKLTEPDQTVLMSEKKNCQLQISNFSGEQVSRAKKLLK